MFLFAPKLLFLEAISGQSLFSRNAEANLLLVASLNSWHSLKDSLMSVYRLQDHLGCLLQPSFLRFLIRDGACIAGWQLSQPQQLPTPCLTNHHSVQPLHVNLIFTSASWRPWSNICSCQSPLEKQPASAVARFPTHGSLGLTTSVWDRMKSNIRNYTYLVHVHVYGLTQ